MAQLHTFSGRLPDDRTELYADAVRLLLQRWESRMGQAASLLQTLDVPGLKLSDLEAGLYRVTFNAHAGGAAGDAAAGAATADIPEGELRGWLAPYLGGSYDMAGLFVDYIRERAGLLYRHKPAAYTFPHRTFQEFLAACELAGRPDYPGEAARLVQADLNRWGEVFVCRAHPPAEPGHRRGQRALPP